MTTQPPPESAEPKRLCAYGACIAPAVSNGLCNAHWSLNGKRRPPPESAEPAPVATDTQAREADTGRPAVIYYIEERRGPSKEGPWGPWGDPKAAGRLIWHSFTSVRLLSEQECRPACMSIGLVKGQQEWRELRCIPYTAPATPAPAGDAEQHDKTLEARDDAASIREPSALETVQRVRVRRAKVPVASDALVLEEDAPGKMSAGDAEVSNGNT